MTGERTYQTCDRAKRFASVGLVVFSTLAGARGEGHNGSLPQKPADLFKLQQVWKVHLKFTRDQWAAMEPKGEFGGFGGRPGRPMGGPFFGGPGGDAGEFGGFGPAATMAPAFFYQGDQDRDGKLSQVEFEALSLKWYAAWDSTGADKLTDSQIQAGLKRTFGMSDDPGSFRGGPRRMNLQGPEGKRNGLASAMGIEFNYAHADLEFEGAAFKDVGVRYKGNGTFMESRGSLKRSLKVELNRNLKGQSLAGVTKLNLHNCVTDASWMNEVLSYRLYRDAGVPAPRTAYARVFVTVPGEFDHQYLGLYSLVEEVDKHFTEENFGTAKGSLFKPVTPDLFSVLAGDWSKYRQTYDPKTHLTPEAKQRVIDFCRFVSGADDSEFNSRLGDYLNLDEFARFMAVMVFLSDMDGILGPGQNLYLFLPPDNGKFWFVPWDQDHSFGQFAMRGTQEERENLSILKPWDGENRFLERVYKLELFKRLYIGHLKDFSQAIFGPERFLKQVDELAAALRPSVQEESEEQLARFDRVVAGEQIGPRSGRGFRGFGQPTKPIKAFVKVRGPSISDQIAGKTQGQRVSGFGFGPPRGPGGGTGGPERPNTSAVMASVFVKGFDTDHDGGVSKPEFKAGFSKWFEAWNSDKSGLITEDQLRTGLNKSFASVSRPVPDGADFGPPPGPPPGE